MGKLAWVVAFMWIAGGCDSSEEKSPGTTATELPDGTSCAPAPSDVPGAAEAWQTYTDWRLSNAERCLQSRANVESYDCVRRSSDPRQVAAYTACMMKKTDCSDIGSDDDCYAEPAGTELDPSVEARALEWYQNVCSPKSKECGFWEDHCGVIVAKFMRPEMRCAIIECIDGPCEQARGCIDAVKTRFELCAD